MATRTIISDDFDRADSDVVGNGWDEGENITAGDVVSIVSNACKFFYPAASGGSPVFMNYTHGTLTLPASISFKLSTGTASGTSYFNCHINSIDGVNYGSGVTLQINTNSSNNLIYSNGQPSTGFSYNFAQTVYVWIDYADSGSNITTSLYLNTSNSKPGSPTITKTSSNGNGNTDTSFLKLFVDGNSGGTQIIDDFVFTDSTSEITTLTPFLYSIDNAGYIYKANADLGEPLSNLTQKSLTQNWAVSDKVTILQSMQGDVIWSYIKTGAVGAIGRVWTGAQDGGTSATVLTDGSETFTSKVVAGDTVYNLTDGSSGTVTSVSGSTVTCSGGLTGGTDNQWEDGDKYEVYASNFQVLTANSAVSPTGTNASTRSRQMVNFEGTTYILNDNYLESISSNFTYTAAFLQLHRSYIGECMAVNGNRLLICANYNGIGKTHLWNGFGTDFTYKIDFPDEIKSVVAYKEGWIVVCGGAVYYTDGFRLQLLDTFLSIRKQDDFVTHINGMTVKDDQIYINGSPSTYDKERSKAGVHVFSPSRKSWGYLPYAQSGTLALADAAPGVLMFEPTKNIIYSAYETILVTNPYYVSTIEDGGSVNALYLYTYDFGREVDLKRVILELDAEPNFGNALSGQSITVRGGFSILDDIIWTYSSLNAASSGADDLNVDGTILRTIANKGVLVLTGSAGGSFDFISSIAGDATTSEVWTMTNDLLGTSENAASFNMIPFYKSEDISYTLSRTQGLDKFIFENIPAEAQHGRRFGCVFYITSNNLNFRIKSVNFDIEGAMR